MDKVLKLYAIILASRADGFLTLNHSHFTSTGSPLTLPEQLDMVLTTASAAEAMLVSSSCKQQGRKGRFSCIS
jgi:hypothetical protein